MVLPYQQPLIAIVGPTASGKSDLAVRLARKFRGEVISADSRQVYRGLDIGTGKIALRARASIPHHLLDIANPKRPFTVVDFQQRAARAIATIAARGRVPILVGGTGFWVDAVLEGACFPAVPPNASLRRRLATHSVAGLFAMLRRIDPSRARSIESRNPRRLIRAIEIASLIGRVPKLVRSRPPYRVFIIGLNPPLRTLEKRIAERAGNMISRGLVKEVSQLLKGGISRRRILEFGFEYRAAFGALESRLDQKALREGLTRETQKYARRQMRWFRRNPNIHWVESKKKAEQLVRQFLRQS